MKSITFLRTAVHFMTLAGVAVVLAAGPVTASAAEAALGTAHPGAAVHDAAATAAKPARSAASERARKIRAKAHRNAARAKAHARAMREADSTKS